MTFEGFPFIMGWELTLFCNLDCKHCGSSAGAKRKRELNLKESLAICEQLPELLVQEVNFTGGEPLISPHWETLSVYLNKLGIKTKILTNGLTLNDSTVARIKKANIAGVGISLDGLEETHDYIRSRKGLSKKVFRGIERIKRAGLPLTIITTATKKNIHELAPLSELLVAAGVKQWQIQPIFPLGRAQDRAELQLDEFAYLQLGAFVQRQGPKLAAAGLELQPGNSFGYFSELDTREPPWRGCPAGLFSCGITSDGKVKGCLSMPDELIEGDLRKNDLWDIWFHPDAFPYTRQFSAKKLGPFCQSCAKSEQCRGGCVSMSYGNTGCFNNDPYCFYRIKNEGAREGLLHVREMAVT